VFLVIQVRGSFLDMCTDCGGPVESLGYMVANVPRRWVPAFRAGVAAARKGKLITACPYNDRRMASIWRDGHYAGSTFIQVDVRGY
jgi:hypothetical protein